MCIRKTPAICFDGVCVVIFSVAIQTTPFLRRLNKLLPVITACRVSGIGYCLQSFATSQAAVHRKWFQNDNRCVHHRSWLGIIEWQTEQFISKVFLLLFHYVVWAEQWVWLVCNNMQRILIKKKQIVIKNQQVDEFDEFIDFLYLSQNASQTVYY